MRNRDESVAIRALIVAVESNTAAIKHIAVNVQDRLDTIDTHISTLIDTVAEHIANHGSGE
jgi:hypothetical protein